jgi:hypothetical protein
LDAGTRNREGGALMAAGAAGQLGAKIDCLGLLVPRAEVERIHKSLYWGGGIWGDPAGPESDFTKAMVRFAKAGAKVPECTASHFIGDVSKDSRNAESFKAFLQWHRSQYPDEYERPALVRMVARCGQLMQQAETGGRDTGYGLWLATLSIIRFSDSADDEAALEELTGQHADYDPATAQWKMASLNSPFRCDTFASEEPAICGHCKYQGSIVSPVALGFEREPRIKSGGQL